MSKRGRQVDIGRECSDNRKASAKALGQECASKKACMAGASEQEARR